MDSVQQIHRQTREFNQLFVNNLRHYQTVSNKKQQDNHGANWHLTGKEDQPPNNCINNNKQRSKNQKTQNGSLRNY